MGIIFMYLVFKIVKLVIFFENGLTCIEICKGRSEYIFKWDSVFFFLYLGNDIKFYGIG